MRSRGPFLCYLSLAGILLCFSCQQPKEAILITNVQLVDGKGNSPANGAIRIAEGKIQSMGGLSITAGDSVIDGQGATLSPGFIDSHSHHDWDPDRSVLAAVSQGITTIVIGQDGSSNSPLASYFNSLETHPLAVNVASYVGHNSLRLEVMGEDFKREATEEEIGQMTEMLKEEMEAGALGIGTGLEYDPGIYSTTEEVISLAKVASEMGGRYISHMRSEDIHLEEAVEEIIRIGKEAEIPVQISHFKLARKGLWGKAGEILKRLDEARAEGVEITADVYPYEYWQSTMTVLFPKRDFTNRTSATFALTELTDPEGMIISDFAADTSYEGKTLAEISAIRNEDPVDVYMKLIAMAEETPGESIIARSMTEEDIFTLLQWPYANVCSDGSYRGHPRGWGAFPRYFSKMDSIPIENRVQKMTSLSARHVGLEGIGVLEVGAPADLVLFYPEELTDRATFDQVKRVASGISSVWVSGVKVYENSRATGKFPGRILKRESR